MERPTKPDIDWNTLEIHSENLAVKFTDGDASHRVMISREALEDGVRTTNQSIEANFRNHRASVDQAILKAFNRSDWQELVQIGTGRKVYHLNVKADDFPKAE